MAKQTNLRILYFKSLLPYQTGWNLQKALQQTLINKKLNHDKENPLLRNTSDHFLVLCQHPPVYTLGKNAKNIHLLLTPYELEKRQIECHHIERGGDITFHGPGQLVGYPIFDLENLSIDLHHYLRLLEQVIIDCLAEYRINAGRINKLTGVWIGFDTPNPRKIAAIGLKISRWVTMHGFALNINTDLSYFEHIIPCGISDKGVTSLEHELIESVNFDTVASLLTEKIIDLFQFSSAIHESTEETLMRYLH